MNKAFLLILLLAALPAEARDRIRAAGSSTVFPFVAASAEAFGESGKFKTPIIEATGTGGGFKLFCEGLTDASPDLANASRPISLKEREQCQKNGITKIAELAIGYDGIVLANATTSTAFNITIEQLFLALAKEVPINGGLTANPYRRWSDIDKALPAIPIEVYGPPATSGTRDAFVELVMEKACHAFPAYKATYPEEARRKAACKLMREDGGYIDAGEDDNLIIQKLAANPQALGLFGYGFLMENRGKVQASAIGGVLPTMENIESGRYAIARSLYVYVKTQRLAQTTGLREFLQELVSNAAIGPDGYLMARGLLPLPATALARTQATAAALSP